jgi:hypothetical protein
MQGIVDRMSGLIFVQIYSCEAHFCLDLLVMRQIYIEAYLSSHGANNEITGTVRRSSCMT